MIRVDRCNHLRSTTVFAISRSGLGISRRVDQSQTFAGSHHCGGTAVCCARSNHCDISRIRQRALLGGNAEYEDPGDAMDKDVLKRALLGACFYASSASVAQGPALAAGATARTANDSQVDSRVINIVSGSYGQNCGEVQGNATLDLSWQCDRRQACSYVLSGGDATRSSTCRPDFRVQWRCSDTEFHSAALSVGAKAGDTLVLSCKAETGPGK